MTVSAGMRMLLLIALRNQLADGVSWVRVGAVRHEAFRSLRAREYRYLRKHSVSRYAFCRIPADNLRVVKWTQELLELARAEQVRQALTRDELWELLERASG